MSKNRRRDLALIHLGQRELKLSMNQYRTLLVQMTGKSSARKLDDHERDQVIEAMQKLGYKPKAAS